MTIVFQNGETVLHFHKRAEIGLRPATSANPVMKNKLILHYSTGKTLGQKDFKTWWRSIQTHHMSGNGWLDIGYNFGVVRDANNVKVAHILEGRGWDRIGAHTPGQNSAGIGVCFLGEDDPAVTDLTAAVTIAFEWLHREAIRRFGNVTIYGHRDFTNTQCPGNEIYAWITAQTTNTHETKERAMSIAIEPRGSASHPTKAGGWVFGAHGHVYAFEEAGYFEAWDDNTRIGRTCVALVPTETGNGYWLVSSAGEVYAFGDAPYTGNYRKDEWGDAPIIGAYRGKSEGMLTLVRDDGANLNLYRLPV